MGWQIVQNPKTKNFQVFSSVTDTFVFDQELTEKELTEFWKEEFGRQGEFDFNNIMTALKKGERPYYQFTKSYECALEWHTHSMTHKYGAQCTDENSKLHPKTCGICSDIEKDFKED